MDLNSIPGWFDYASLYNRVVRLAPPGSLLVEVGVYAGRSLCHLGMMAKKADKGLRVVGVDWCQDIPEQMQVIFENVAAAGLSETVGLYPSDSVSVAKSSFKDGEAFFVFIDAAHDEESVAADLAAWGPKVSSGGIFAGHDIQEPGVRAAVGKAFGRTGWRIAPDAASCWEQVRG